MSFNRGGWSGDWNWKMRPCLGGGEPLLQGAGAEMGWRQGRAVGCYLHGLLADDHWRAAFLNVVREDRGRLFQPARSADPIDLRIDRWAQHLRRSFRGDAWSRLLSTVTGPSTPRPPTATGEWT